jgi:predicted HTH transcriptional regulator
MIKLNKDKIQIRYITGIGKTQLNYPTSLDILYESCVENADETLFSRAKMENRYGTSDAKIDEVINDLLDKKYIVQSGSKFKIVGTPWD